LRTSDVLKDILVPVNASQPVLVCVGEKETFVAKNMARQYLRSLKNSKGFIVPQAGHVWNLQNPKLFSDTVRAWISDKPLPSQLIPL
jgi:pimeloyl-ACP methyl ester carboxylesterase